MLVDMFLAIVLSGAGFYLLAVSEPNAGIWLIALACLAGAVALLARAMRKSRRQAAAGPSRQRAPDSRRDGDGGGSAGSNGNSGTRNEAAEGGEGD